MKNSLFAILVLFCFVGCGLAPEANMTATSPTAKPSSSNFYDLKSRSAAAEPRMLAMAGKEMGDSTGSDGKGYSEVSPVSNQPNRKIIYTADIKLVVEDFTGLEKRIAKLVADHGGFLAGATLDRMQGHKRSGRWVARIPVDKYDSFVNATGDLGVPESRIQNAQDVTEEFVDITARIENKKKLEQRIIKLLERPEDKIQHVIEVERELGRVREDIERMEGRLRFLADQTALTTVSIDAREEADYVPPQAPGFGDRIATAWQGGIKNARVVCENFVVFAVYNAIPIVLWGLVAVGVAFLARRMMRTAPAA